MNFWQSIHLGAWFFKTGVALAFLGILGYLWAPAYVLFIVGLYTFYALIIVDLLLLFLAKGKLTARRVTHSMFSLGYENPVKIFIQSTYSSLFHFSILEEAPIEFQRRNLHFDLGRIDQQEKIITYSIKPNHRGKYHFGRINILAESPLHLIKRRLAVEEVTEVKVYPSIMHMRETEFVLLSKTANQGLKKIRRPGYNFEFEEIKEYVGGDDIRKINWKATARKRNLMINVYQQESAQPVYCILNKGRTMQMPFDGLSLLDHSINSILAVANVTLKKGDKSGLITFEKNIDTFLSADARRFQLKKILESLYDQQTVFEEPNYYDLYSEIKNRLNKRSLLLFFTNFETLSSLEQQMELFKRLNRNHVLVVILFENTQLKELIKKEAQLLVDIYQVSIAEKFDLEKRMIKQHFLKHGIQAILTNPKNLTIDVLNKYLEIKQRGLI